jgi:hypothetical protein
MAIKPFPNSWACAICKTNIGRDYRARSIEWTEVDGDTDIAVRYVEPYCAEHWKEVRKFFAEVKDELLTELEVREADLTIEKKHELTRLFFDRLTKDKEWEV